MREYKTKMRGEKKSVNFHSKLVARDRYSKNLEHKKELDPNIFNNGYEWFNNGFTLNDAPEEMRNNDSFIAGFKKGERLKFINQQLFDLGKEYFESNIPFDSIPDNYKNNEFFMAGYNDIKDNRHKK